MRFLLIAVPWCSLLAYLMYKWCDKIDKEGGYRRYDRKSAPYNYTNYNNMYTPRAKSKFKLIKHKPLREKPPNASFFGRMDGKDISIEGPYEEGWLTAAESIKWQKKKAKIEREKNSKR